MALNKGTAEAAQAPAQTEEFEDVPFAANSEVLEEPVPAEQQVATTGNVTQLEPPAPTSKSKFEEEMAEEGFEGMDLDRWSFTQIKIDDGVFMDEEDTKYGEELECVVLASKAKWVLKNTKCDDKDKQSHFCYDHLEGARFSGTDANSGEMLNEVIADWKESNWGFAWGQYLEAQAVVMSGALEGVMVILSIPPTSRTRFSGKFRRAQLQLGIRSPREALLKCIVGPKATNAVGQSFNPWKFEVVRKLTEDEMVDE